MGVQNLGGQRDGAEMKDRVCAEVDAVFMWVRGVTPGSLDPD